MANEQQSTNAVTMTNQAMRAGLLRNRRTPQPVTSSDAEMRLPPLPGPAGSGAAS